MRVAGRLRLRGTRELAEVIMHASPWFRGSLYGGGMSYLAALAAAESEDIAELQQLAEKTRGYANNTTDTNYAADAHARLAHLAARKGDEALFRRTAVAVGGFVSDRRAAASPAVLLRLTEAAALVGQWDMAKQFLGQSKAAGTDRDVAAACIVCEMAKRGQIAGARSLAEQVRDPSAKARVSYALANAEAAASSAKLSSIILQIVALPTSGEKAAAFGGMAAALWPK